jgi:transposase
VVRDQEFLLPPNMAEWLPEDHLVWFVIDVIDRLDTKAFHARAKRGGVGRQGFDPDMLLSLLVYAYAVGERSSRRIERLCVDHVAFRVLCGQDPPDHTTIARFRAAHQDAFAGLFAQVLRLAKQAGMVRVGVVAIDGTKIAADAARAANRSPEWIRKEAQRLAQQLAQQILAEAAEVDEAEDTAEAKAGSGPDDRLPPGLADRRGRAANIDKALAELDRQDAADRAVDAAEQQKLNEYLKRVESGESIRGILAGIDRVAYHRAQVERHRRRIAEVEGVRGHAATRQRAEARRQLTKALAALAAAEKAAETGQLDTRGAKQRARARREERIRARGGTGRTVNVTDPDSRLMTTANGGSVQGYNAQLAVSDDHLILGIHLSQDANDTGCFAPTLAAVEATVTSLNLSIGTVLADAGYFTHDNLTLAGPDRLIAPGKHRELLDEIREHPTTGSPPEDATPEEAMRHRLRTIEGAHLYKRRSATVEPVNAHIKELIGLHRFSRRGLPAVTAELNLAAAAHNIRRMFTAAPQPC